MKLVLEHRHVLTPVAYTYDFAFTSIPTDGVSTSLLMTRKDLLDSHGNPGKNLSANDLAEEERYVDSLTSEEITKLNLTGKKIVAIDANQHDLIFCVSPKTESEKIQEGFDLSNKTRSKQLSQINCKKKGGIQQEKKRLKKRRKDSKQRQKEKKKSPKLN
ncbi:hypothetical protein GEMRC1_004073 [Eukaryota sp. GEM-RC1]